MKKTMIMMVVMAALTLSLGLSTVYAQEADDVPYLSDEDIAALEVTLPEDVPEIAGKIGAEAEGKTGKEIVANEMSRLNVYQPLYHLLILDRARCALNSDISGIDRNALLYKLIHGKNGYLIAIYRSPIEGPVFPMLPNNARIILNLMTNRLNTIKEYVNSVAFRKFVTSQRILAQIIDALETDF